ncbi:cupin domain-containing protein [Hoeflea prorocentri]|uniref:Cupin domain-containing protein n=1 Tax=Hoeflea prorocentri TaxID=1922333 RepID=A0A9X3ZJT7_9HYPH|nr:cupin domain-containing protein [Hoeflea prorocentri]MCY6383326.1 cupin domain-containing protein [Hoeflea prorocentri]MDA5401126.1 cupin domain-containing protein [Hoeflea prorocentri]
MEKINLEEKFALIGDYWQPHIAAQSNGQHIRLAKLKGEFVWHAHDEEDELFIVIKGSLTVRFRDRDIKVAEGEMLVVPRGVEHMPVADDEVHLVNITMAQTTMTGNVASDRAIPVSKLQSV